MTPSGSFSWKEAFDDIELGLLRLVATASYRNAIST